MKLTYNEYLSNKKVIFDFMYFVANMTYKPKDYSSFVSVSTIPNGSRAGDRHQSEAEDSITNRDDIVSADGNIG